MGIVISLDQKRKSAQHQHQIDILKKKQTAARKFFQCARCAVKCEKCGAEITPNNQPPLDSVRLPYWFCASCAEEYADYIDALTGIRKDDHYWYNNAWMRIWSSWIEYRGAIDSYLKSKAFKQLIDELSADPS
ncbi:hypothetical protein LJC71_09015 [Desulfosarcina sp. OttesenSCG-928-A07]|nr:hypothetical protein [Desulfosarcina sp. OttesenSCG-928-G17]MDL2329865.1 hypothetical protein [Desulfosarcina sp. OttesenSCG-928-A07]